MSIPACKQTLLSLLKNEELKVIALSGAWGTGKTELWKAIQRDSTDEKIVNAATASMFGLRDVNSLRMRAMQSAAFKDSQESVTGRSLQGLLSAGVKALKGAYGAFGAMDDLALLLMPVALKNKLVVIDDIERKHQDLTADEVLGFIDECCNQYGCRVLLILNEDKMADVELWNTFREKVIDAEVRLQTTPAEALSIALEHTPSPYADQIMTVADRCGVSNIRILRRVIRACNLILDPYPSAHQSTLDRVIPSVVLLGIAHFKGVDDAPDLDFALKGTHPTPLALRNAEAAQRPLTEEEQAENHYAQWLQKFGLQVTDQLEAEIVSFYRSGQPDAGVIAKLLEANEADSRKFATQSRANTFLTRCFWHPNLTEASLIQEAEDLVDGACYLDANTATSVCKAVAELNGGADVGERLIDAWIVSFNERIAIDDQELDWQTGHPTRSPLHQKIVAAFSSAIAARENKVGISEACLRINYERAWGKAETNQLSGATSDSYAQAIQAAEGRELIAIMSVMVDIAKGGLDENAHFGAAGRRFVDACRQLHTREPTGRLAKLIEHLFRSEGLSELLTPI